jgi:hypothetical protein
MAILDEIGARLTTLLLVDGATGWALCKAFLPASPDKVVLLSELGGLGPEQRVQLDHPEIQVRVRGERFGYAAARTRMQAIYDALHTYSGTLSGIRYASIAAVQSPIGLGFDDNERPEIVCTFRCARSR